VQAKRKSNHPPGVYLGKSKSVSHEQTEGGPNVKGEILKLHEVGGRLVILTGEFKDMEGIREEKGQCNGRQGWGGSSPGGTI